MGRRHRGTREERRVRRKIRKAHDVAERVARERALDTGRRIETDRMINQVARQAGK